MPQGCEDGQGGDAAALQVGAAAQVQGLQLEEAGEGCQVDCLANALAVLHLEADQPRKAAQGLQPVILGSVSLLDSSSNHIEKPHFTSKRHWGLNQI